MNVCCNNTIFCCSALTICNRLQGIYEADGLKRFKWVAVHASIRVV